MICYLFLDIRPTGQHELYKQHGPAIVVCTFILQLKLISGPVLFLENGEGEKRRRRGGGEEEEEGKEEGKGREEGGGTMGRWGDGRKRIGGRENGRTGGEGRRGIAKERRRGVGVNTL